MKNLIIPAMNQPPAIYAVIHKQTGEYWSNELGWLEPDDDEIPVSIFTDHEIAAFSPPIGGEFVLL